MHTSMVVITREFPTDEVLDKVMEPYNDEAFYEKYSDEDEIPKDAEWPKFTWDYFVVGGRYGGRLKLRMDMEDQTYKWGFYAKEPRAGRLFRSTLCERVDAARREHTIFSSFEDEYRGYLGAPEGYIRVDGCKVKDVIDFEKTVLEGSFGIIGKDGKVICREYYGEKFEENENYEEEVKEELKDVQDCYVTYLDVHD